MRLLVLFACAPALARADATNVYKEHPINISSNPLGALFDFWGLSVEIAQSPNHALRFDADLWGTTPETRIRGYEAGVSVPIYLARTYLGPFIEPGLVVRSSHVLRRGGFNYRAWGGAELLFGGQITLPSGWNAAIALGVVQTLVTFSGVTDKDYIDGYLRIGKAF